MTFQTATLLTAATLGVVGINLPAAACEDCGCGKTSAAVADGEKKECPADCTKPCCSGEAVAESSDKSADELFAAFNDIPEPDIDRTRYNSDEAYRAETQDKLQAYYDAKMSSAKAFVNAYPADERAGRLLPQLAMSSEGVEADKYNAMLEEHHPEIFAEIAAAKQAEEAAAKKLKEAIGKPFELTFTDLLSGEEISVQEDLKGKVVVVDFWATWCGPCIAEMPKMKELYAEYKDQGVEFIGVSLDDADDKQTLIDMVNEKELAWKHYFQGNGWDSEFSRSWGIQGIPTIFIVDADGKLVSTEARGQLEKMIPELIEKRDSSEQASAE